MVRQLRSAILPPAQRRTLEELTEDLDLRSGDRGSKQSAFWTMLVLSAVIASAGVLADSTATVIGAMIVAPLGTAIMGIALALVKRQRNGSIPTVVAGSALVVSIGAIFSFALPAGLSLESNAQIAGRVSPGALDMVAALATGLAGAVALARRDVAAVLPGVAIAISLVPPLAVVGICLGRGEPTLALGALALFLSNLLSMVLAGSLVFAALGYADTTEVAPTGTRARSYLVVGVLLFLIGVPLAIHSAATYTLTTYQARVESAAREWLDDVPRATVTGSEIQGLDILVTVEAPDDLPSTARLEQLLARDVPDVFGVAVQVSVTEVLPVRESSVAG